MLIKIVIASLLSRKTMALLTCFSIAISFFVLIGVEQLRTQVKDNFERTVSGVDLIVGSRTSSINLLLFSVFKIGNPSNNIQWQSYQTLASSPLVDWTVPISMGDSHQGFAVIGTTEAYFDHFKYAQNAPLLINQGKPFSRLYEVVLGAEVANKFAYQLGDEIVLSHGTGKVSFSHHDEYPFTVAGILKRTGTPVDQSIFMPLQAIEIIHSHHAPANKTLSDIPLDASTAPELSAFFLGSQNKLGLLKLQRDINQFKPEPLTAILPLVALRELWQVVSMVEQSLTLISWFILITALIGMTIMLLASMQERNREFAILRALGAKAPIIVLMIMVEAVLLTLVGAVLGYLIASLCLQISMPVLEQLYGLFINPYIELGLVLPFVILSTSAAIILSLLPGIAAYRRALTNGLRQ